jgi:nucleoside-diphosphate-sugar epimerase
VFSSSSVESKQDSDDPAERNQVREMLKLESELQILSKDMGFKLVIFRPTLIYGCGLDTNISRLASWIGRFGFIPVNGRARGLRQPVHADDLAAVAVAALFTNTALPPILAVSGGDTLSYSDMVARIFITLEKPVRLLRLPEWLFVLLVRLASIFKSARGLNSEMVRRQQVDLVFDDHQARNLLDYRPRPFSPGKNDFCMPGNFTQAGHL